MGMLTDKVLSTTSGREYNYETRNSKGERLGDLEGRSKSYLGTGFGTDESGFTDDMIANWMRGGPLPTLPDPTKAFGDASKLAPVRERALSGMGMSGLFNFGSKAGVKTGAPPLPKLPKLW